MNNTRITESITSNDTEKCLRDILNAEGYELNDKRGLGKLGPDILAVKEKEILRIEVIGYSESALERNDFFYRAFFRAISRLNEKDCKYCIIAMPYVYKKYLPVKARIYRIAWKRIASAFPELEIWLVDISRKKYHRTSWISWLKQKK